MRGIRTVAAVWLTAGVAAGGFGVAGAAPAPGPPSAAAGSTVVSVGHPIRVQGSGWGSDTSQVVSVVLCGNAALDGAADCDLAATAEGGLRADGTFSTLFTVPPPPMACPCVLRVFSPASPADVKIPVTVIGAETAPPQQRVFTRRAVRIDGVHLEGRGPWPAWFGAPARRTLVYRVTNTGDVVLHDPPVDAVWGRGARPDGFVAVPAVGDLAVGATRTFRVPIRFSALSFGTYRAVIRVDPFGTVGTGQATTGLTPWGLIAAAVGIPLSALIRMGAARRTRRAIRPIPLVGGLSPALICAPAAGWYADPLSDAGLRLWDGQAWTGETRTVGVAAAAVPIEDRRSGGPLTLVLEDAS
jgi:hypothetical protein